MMPPYDDLNNPNVTMVVNIDTHLGSPLSDWEIDGVYTNLSDCRRQLRTGRDDYSKIVSGHVDEVDPGLDHLPLPVAVEIARVAKGGRCVSRDEYDPLSATVTATQLLQEPPVKETFEQYMHRAQFLQNLLIEVSGWRVTWKFGGKHRFLATKDVSGHSISCSNLSGEHDFDGIHEGDEITIRGICTGQHGAAQTCEQEGSEISMSDCELVPIN